MFYKSGKVISDQFEHLNMFSFWENSENRCHGGGRVGGSPILTLLFHFITQNVIILVKTKDVPKAAVKRIGGTHSPFCYLTESFCEWVFEIAPKFAPEIKSF